MKKEVKIVSGIAIVIVLIGAIYLLSKQNRVNEPGEGTPTGEIPAEMLENQTQEAAEETQKLIDEVVTEGVGTTTTITVNTPTSTEGSSTPQVIKAVAVNAGTSLIDTTSGKVITETGKVVNNAAPASSPEAPQQSYPIKPEEAAKSAIKLQVTSTSFTPNSFTVNRGQVVNLVVTNVNETTFSEVFRFDDPSLSAVVIGLAKGETKSMTFNAPTKAGEYTFYSSMFDHRAQGSVGKMIVK